MVPMNLDVSENKRNEISELIKNSSIDLQEYEIGEESDNVGPGYDITHVEIPGDVFLDEHTLKIRRFRPDSMKINVGESEESADKVGILLELHHELSRSIPSLIKAEPKLFQALRELNYHNLPYDDKKEYLDSFGGNSVVEFVVRSLDEYDFRTKHWRELKTELAHLFTIDIHDYDTPERYHWNDDLLTLRDIDIQTLAGENNYLDTQEDFIENLLPKQIYLRMVNTAKKNTVSITRHYFDDEKIPIGTIGPKRLDLRLGTGMNCGPIEYFLQKKGQTYLWNGPANTFPSFEIGPQKSETVSTDVQFTLNLTKYPNPQIIHLSAGRTVGDNSSEYSELYEFAKSMKSKISDAEKFLKQQSENVANNLKLPVFETPVYDEDLPIDDVIDRYGGTHCVLDSKSTEFGIPSLDMYDKRSVIEQKRSRIIDETDTYLDLIASSMLHYKDQIRQLTDFNVNFNALVNLNIVESDNIIYAHDNNISIKMMWNAIEDLTSIFRLQKMLQQHFGKEVTISQGEFLFTDQSSKKLSINQLSSGEKQLILLYWKILDGMDRKVMQNIVLIDEPELSLHITWQRDFIENLEELLIKQSRYGDEADGAYNVKIIIATHSPSILTNHIDKTYELGLSDGV